MEEKIYNEFRNQLETECKNILDKTGKKWLKPDVFRNQLETECKKILDKTGKEWLITISNVVINYKEKEVSFTLNVRSPRFIKVTFNINDTNDKYEF